MVALVLFGCIWAVGVLTGGSPEGEGAAGRGGGQVNPEHLLERHFRHFAFVGVERALWSNAGGKAGVRA